MEEVPPLLRRFVQKVRRDRRVQIAVSSLPWFPLIFGVSSPLLSPCVPVLVLFLRKKKCFCRFFSPIFPYFEQLLWSGWLWLLNTHFHAPPASAQHVKSSKLVWPGWWGSMLPGYDDGVRKFSQGVWGEERAETEARRCCSSIVFSVFSSFVRENPVVKTARDG